LQASCLPSAGHHLDTTSHLDRLVYIVNTKIYSSQGPRAPMQYSSSAVLSSWSPALAEQIKMPLLDVSQIVKHPLPELLHQMRGCSIMIITI